jgi:deoxyribodipyrimidine photo-lyase
VASEEQQTEDLVKSELVKIHCNFQTFSTSTLYLAEDLPFPVKDIPDVFTHFRKATELKAVVRKALAKPSCIKSPEIKPIDLPSFADLNLAFTAMDNRAALKFIGGETEAIARLNHYFFESRAISQYKETRNGLVGADYSSKFSAWLAHGCLSPRFIYQELKNYEAQFGANESSYWLVFELLWRDYFCFMMKKYKAKFFQLAGIQTNAQKEIKTNPQQLQDWVDGNTGIDFVDANMLELKLTGFMSNRGRQNVASFLCNDLNLDWRCGAAYFE